jgi:hypothetical protein
LQALAYRVRNEDAKDGEKMSATVAPGKKVSMYDYMKGVVETVVGKGNGEMVLSFLYGRLVNAEFPPTIDSKFLFDEIAEGKHKTTLGEARTLVSK